MQISGRGRVIGARGDRHNILTAIVSFTEPWEAHLFAGHLWADGCSEIHSDPNSLSPGTDKLVETIPLRRLGLPGDVAKAIYYLCTDQSSYVTGTEIHMNGGQHV